MSEVAPVKIIPGLGFKFKHKAQSVIGEFEVAQEVWSIKIWD
jgi:hypothetical protein